MKFIHTSDWQLGKPFGRATDEARAALQDARLEAIDAVADAARTHSASFVLVAGDVFDSSEPGDRVYRQALTRMKARPDLRWLLLPGNHDPARADGLWTRLTSEAPVNVTACVEPSVVEVAEGVAVFPAPLQYKRVLDDPTAWFASAETGAARRIGLAHGSIKEFGSAGSGTNLIAPDRAKLAGLDYLGLGDWHAVKSIDPRTWYSGTPEPDDFGREDTGKVLLVELGSRGDTPVVTRIPTGRYTWADETLHLSSNDDHRSRIAQLAPDIERKNLVLRLRVNGVISLSERVDLMQHLLDELAHEIRWLDLRADELFAHPTDTDLGDIDAHGILRAAADRLAKLSEEPGDKGRAAAAALERLYFEHRRTDRTGVQ